MTLLALLVQKRFTLVHLLLMTILISGIAIGSAIAFTPHTVLANACTPPVISGITAQNIQSSAATISWTTDKGASSQITYGLTTDYGATSTDATLVTTHSLSLSGLTASTTYHYQITSIDSLGDVAQSSDQTFTTGAASATNPLRIVGDLTRANYTADITATGTEERQSRAPSYLSATSTELWLVYTNWWLDIGAGGREVNTGNPVALGAAIEYNGKTVIAPNAGSGAAAHTMADGDTFLAGPFYPADFGLTVFPAGAQLFVRTDETVQPGQAIPRAGQYLSESPASRLASSTGSSQLSGMGAFKGATPIVGPGPTMVIGRATGPTLSIIEIGDSIGEGYEDTSQYPNPSDGGGYFQRGAWNAGKVSLVQLGRQGGTLARLFNGTDGAKRLALMQYATDVFVEFGANDLFYVKSSNVYTTFENNLTNYIAQLRAQGVSRISVSTVAPRTQSNDSFIDQAGQVTQGPGVGLNGYWDTNAVAGVNSFIQNLKTNGTIDDVFDVNPLWGYGGSNASWITNNSAWYPIPSPGDGVGNLGGAYINGTHPSPALYTIAGAAMTTKIKNLTPLP